MRNRILIIILAALALVGVILYLTIGGEAATEATLPDVVINEVMAANSSIPDDQGEYSDWLEFYNRSDHQVNLSGYGLSDDMLEIKWVFPQGTVLEPGEYLVVYCSGSGTESSAAPFHAPFKLAAGKDTAMLTDVYGHPYDQYFLGVTERNHSMGRSLEDGAAWEEFDKPTPGYENSAAGRVFYEQDSDASAIGLIISEFQCANATTLAAGDGGYYDWIEIYNPTDKTVDMSSFGLSDDQSSPLKWRLGEDTVIGPGEYLVIYASGGMDREGEIHATFKLSSYKESVVLANKVGQIIDSVDYSDIPEDHSMGRDASTTAWTTYSTPTPGFENTDAGYEQFLAVAAVYSSPVYISEVMLTNSQFLEEKDGEFYDWVEVYNSSGGDVDLSGYGLTNNSGNPKKWTFPEGTVLKSGEYLTLLASGTTAAEAKKKYDEGDFKYLHLNFKLSNTDGDVLTLWNREGGLLDKLALSTQRDLVSYGRSAPGAVPLYYAAPTPGEQNGSGFSSYADTPTIALPAGWYNGVQTTQILGAGEIRYTTDGSAPTKNSPQYTGEIPVTKTATIRARAFEEGKAPSVIATSSYLIDSPHGPDLSVVMLAVNEEDLYDRDKGILAMGSNAAEAAPYKGANFWQEWERPCHAEIFDTQGNLQVSMDLSIRVFGAYSRGREQKGLALIARSAYGSDRIYYPLFENRPYDSYRAIVLRAGGQDSTVTKMRDIIATSLVDGATNLEVQAYRQAVVYMNGEYFGIYNIREKVNKYWIEQHYGYDPENIDLLVGNGTALGGSADDYDAMLEFCKNNSLASEENYQKVAAQIDVENYIDYLVCQMYIANSDTGNIKWFRERSDHPVNSKWKWIYYDFCWSLSAWDRDAYAKLTDPEGHGANKGFSTRLNRSLFQNEGFRQQFLNRFAELLGTIYTTENVLARIAQCESVIIDEMERDLARWPEGISVGNWKANVKNARTFAEKRPDYCIYMLQKHFGLSDSQTVELFGRLGSGD